MLQLVVKNQGSYIILGFHNSKENDQKQKSAIFKHIKCHNSKENDQKQKSAIFNHLNISNAYIDLNTNRFPEENLNIDFIVNNRTKPYEMAVI